MSRDPPSPRPNGAEDQPQGASRDPLAAAKARGKIEVAKILNGEGMLSTNAIAERLGTSPGIIRTWRKQSRVLALRSGTRGYRYPAWQLGKDGRPFEALPALFAHLGMSPWTVYRFLTQHHAELGGMTGREALERGQSAKALAAVENMGEAAYS